MTKSFNDGLAPVKRKRSCRETEEILNFVSEMRWETIKAVSSKDICLISRQEASCPSVSQREVEDMKFAGPVCQL